jgi:hypothetical protein
MVRAEPVVVVSGEAGEGDGVEVLEVAGAKVVEVRRRDR